MDEETFSTRLHQQRTALWTRGCILTLGVALLAVAMMLGRLYVVHRRPILDVNPLRINPNTASQASLVRLSGIGRARALDIIHYRQSHAQEGPVFRSPQDLEQIRGIGPKTSAKLSPWLTFDDN
jgi:hypothetical protein